MAQHEKEMGSKATRAGNPRLTLRGGSGQRVLTTEQYKDLEDEAIMHYVKKHNGFLEQINAVNLDDAPPFLLAKVRYWYAWASNYAFQIASYYRKQQKRYEAKSKIDRSDVYELTRKGENGTLKTQQDAYNLAKKAEGLQLDEAGHYESQHMRWKGIAESYKDAGNSIKDMQESVQRENKGGV